MRIHIRRLRQAVTAYYEGQPWGCRHCEATNQPDATNCQGCGAAWGS
ncbi:hypothetical protein ACFXPY_45645 [Streptomyces sp. NPDC059153]